MEDTSYLLRYEYKPQEVKAQQQTHFDIPCAIQSLNSSSLT